MIDFFPHKTIQASKFCWGRVDFCVTHPMMVSRQLFLNYTLGAGADPEHLLGGDGRSFRSSNGEGLRYG